MAASKHKEQAAKDGIDAVGGILALYSFPTLENAVMSVLSVACEPEVPRSSNET